MILRLLEKFQVSSSEFQVPPSPKLETGNSRLETNIFNTDQYRLRTVWGQVMPQDQARLVQNEQILVQTGIHSRKRAMDEVGVKDPETEFKHWMEEQKEVMNIRENPKP